MKDGFTTIQVRNSTKNMLTRLPCDKDSYDKRIKRLVEYYKYMLKYAGGEL